MLAMGVMTIECAGENDRRGSHFWAALGRMWLTTVIWAQSLQSEKPISFLSPIKFAQMPKDMRSRHLLQMQLMGPGYRCQHYVL
jgi:hypothetical protein